MTEKQTGLLTRFEIKSRFLEFIRFQWSCIGLGIVMCRYLLGISSFVTEFFPKLSCNFYLPVISQTFSLRIEFFLKKIILKKSHPQIV